MSSTPVPTIIGRERELARIRRIVAGLREGSGALLLLTGEAGIGKTLLAQVLLDEATGAGDGRTDAAWGRPLQRIVSPALWPWRQLASGIATRRPDGPMARLRAVLDDAAPRSDADTHPDSEAIVVETAAELIRAEAAAGPLVLVVDDVHRYDELSLTLLETLLVDLARHPIVVVATARTSGGFDGRVAPTDGGDVVARLARLPVSVHLPLGRLHDDGIRRLVGDIAGPLETSRFAQIVELAHGNPMFAVELARAVRHAAFDGPQGGHVVERIMAERVASVDGGGVVGALALVGRAASASLLAAVVGEVVPNVTRVLERAAAAGIVTRDGTTLGTYRLLHPLYGDAAVANLSGTEISELHHRIAEALAVAPTRVGPHTVEIARHLVAAGNRRTASIDGRFGERFPERRARSDAHFEASLARTCRDGARWSESVGDVDAAVELAEAALAFDAGDLALRVDLLRIVGRHATSPLERRTAFHEAIETTRSLGTEPFVDTVIDLASVPASGAADHVLASAAVAEALERCGTTSDGRRARLLALRAELLQRRHDPAAAVVWDQARSLAAGADADTICFVLGAAVRMTAPQGAAERLDALATELEAINGLTLDVVTARAGVALARGTRRAIEDVLASESLGTAARSSRPTSVHVLLRASYAVLLGDRAGFRRASDALHGPCPTPWGDARALLALLGTFGRWLAGDPVEPATSAVSALSTDGSWRELDELVDLARLVLAADLDLTAAGEEPGHPFPARPTVGQHRIDGAERRRLRAHDAAWAASWALAARAAWLSGDSDTVEAALAELRGELDAMALVGPLVALGPIGWFVAEPAASIGERAFAAEALCGAENAARRVGADPWLARVLLAQARLAPELEPNSGADHHRSLALEAATFAASLGLTGVERAALSLLDAASAPRPLPLGLTAREFDVLQLAAVGASNVEISQRLHVSVKTVERHFTTLFRRLGVRNRAEAVATLSRDLPD